MSFKNFQVFNVPETLLISFPAAIKVDNRKREEMGLGMDLIRLKEMSSARNCV